LKIIIGMTGSTGAIFGIKLLKKMSGLHGIETHLIISEWGKKNIELETDYSVKEVEDLADYVYVDTDLGARISSGSFRIDAMFIAPCSMKTLAAVSHGYADHLISRAADVILKERKQLIMLTRETPLSSIHLENMLSLSRAGAVIMPPVPAFYNSPKDINDMVEHIVSRMMDQVGIFDDGMKRWQGMINE
jgi:4-hydroxy-3-polyprenylbenzoate decarboxylase